MLNQALEDFRRDFAGCDYPDREELEAILLRGEFEEFTSNRNPTLDCAHYSRIYAIRASNLFRQATPAEPPRYEVACKCQAVAEELHRTPELRCRLFGCVTKDRDITVFARPD